MELIELVAEAMAENAPGADETERGPVEQV
jgi:hypothetical protein